eukprot:CAMPEP_0176395598 /NCGR_PEP_ID=MMETSP0126-20121128/43536_1 /TAXON_ID=141414 ORGANISM="Strombidinopsis acuminatum, Strain SPMC142" /NCGR_SAMPLE_ID=MMETSP0126 /ASSEMBLY_ACC=CAM_ASM_000229 /LENGTH=39 /DNA_ID= /DNA_START= /DNA_END= /DNA_ORIENTATION=
MGTLPEFCDEIKPRICNLLKQFDLEPSNGFVKDDLKLEE